MSTSRAAALRQALAFTAIVYVLVVAIALALPHASATPILSLFTPALTVVLIAFLGTKGDDRKRLWRDLGLGRVGFGSWLPAVGFPIVFLLIAYGAAAVARVATIHRPDLSPHGLALSVPNLVISLALGTVVILGEEIGWRGYLLPRLQLVLSPRRAAGTAGLIHGLFHLPAILLTTTYDSVGSRYEVAPVVVATITFAGIFYAWLRNRSGSIWPVAIAHNAANTAFDLGAAAAVTGTPVTLAYIAGESGIATLVAVAGVAIWLLLRSPVWDRLPLMTTDTDALRLVPEG
jgi:membrane protease YdiL (CAAX protease family)